MSTIKLQLPRSGLLEQKDGGDSQTRTSSTRSHKTNGHFNVVMLFCDYI